MKRLLLSILLLGVSLFVGCGGSSGSGGTTPPAPTLQSITITPASPSIAAGSTQQFSATGTYSDGSTKPVAANWLSATQSVATINVSGLATGVAAGTLIISASSGSITGTTTLTVTAAALVSIAVTPASATVAPNGQQAFTAMGTYASGPPQNITTSVTWNATAGASINPAGLAIGTTPGATSTITATLNGIVSNQATLTVTNPIVSIAVTPANPSIPGGITVQFTATATFSDHTTGNITSTAAWTSSDPTVATVSSQTPTQGLATSIKAGTTTIQASSGGLNGSTILTVTPAVLQSIAIGPPNALNATISLRDQLAYTATGTYTSPPGTFDVTDSATWSSTAPAVAGITTGGFATGIAPGSTTIGAALSGKTDSTSLTVNADNVTAIAITPNPLTLAQGTSRALTATGTLLNGSTLNITSLVTWSSSNATVATASGGNARALTPGSSNITATLNSQTGLLPLTVSNATITSVTVTPLNPTIAVGTKLGFSAIGGFFDGTNHTSQTITNDCAWASGTPSVATMSGFIASGVSQGTANISATFTYASATAADSTQLTVSNATLASIVVTPTTAILAPSTTLGFTATGTFSDGSKQNVNDLVTWSSSDASVVAINSNGSATGQKAGSAVITATAGALTSTANVIVESTPLQAINVTPASVTVPETISTNFAATGVFGDGSQQNLTSFVTWASTPPAVATISSTGRAVGVSPGTASITAAFGGVVGPLASALPNLTVTGATLVSIAVSPPSPTVAKGSTQQFTAMGTFSDSSTVNLTSQVTWSSADVTKVVINSNGLATATGSTTSGPINVSASLNGQTGTASVTVP